VRCSIVMTPLASCRVKTQRREAFRNSVKLEGISVINVLAGTFADGPRILTAL
jgi:hypothetical protein